MKAWERVPFDTEEPSRGALIKIFRSRGKVVATVTEYEWHEPDGHEHTGFADLETTLPRSVTKVLEQFKKASACVALETDDIWNPVWGRLV